MENYIDGQGEAQRAAKALAELGFAFPKNKVSMIDMLKELKPEYVLELRTFYKHEFEYTLRMMESLASTLTFTYCDICDRQETSWGDIPEDWGWYDGSVAWYMMCDECQFRYAEKFNELPELTRKLEEEIEKCPQYDTVE